MQRILTAALLSFAALRAHAASFDCKAAHTPREHAVCSDPKLSALDDKLAAAYKNAQATLSPSAFALVQSDQRDWLRRLDQACPSTASAHDYSTCLTNRYNQRSQQLAAGVQTLNGITFYPRGRFLYTTSGKPSNENYFYDPNIGQGSFTWPQIDNPTPPQQLWNHHVEAAVIALLGDKSPGHTLEQTFHTAASPGTYDTLTYRIRAANQRFLSAVLDNYTYTGGAHGGTSQVSFLWWLDQGRALTASDVFSNPAWKQKLVEPTINKLQTKYGKEMIWKGDELHNAFSKGIPGPTAWTPTSEGLTLTFGQYEVGPYVLGMPEVTFSWDELRPYLNPNLHPETLPPPIPERQ